MIFRIKKPTHKGVEAAGGTVCLPTGDPPKGDRPCAFFFATPPWILYSFYLDEILLENSIGFAEQKFPFEFFPA